MATFITGMVELVGENADLCIDAPNYFDDDTGNTHERCINGLADLAIASGTGPGVYAPASNVTRSQMAGFITRAMDLFVDLGVAQPAA